MVTCLDMPAALTALGIVLAFGPAHGIEQNRTYFKGYIASMGGDYYTQCTEMIVDVTAQKAASKKKDDRQTYPNVVVWVWHYDYCEGRQIIAVSASVQIPATAFTVSGDRKLNGATLVAAVEGYDYACDCSVPLSINIRWTPTGPATQTSSRYSSKAPGTSLSSSYNGTERLAEAVGTIESRDGRLRFDGRGDSASIAYVRSGEVMVTRR